MNPVTAEYIKRFFEKRERKNPYLVKTRYGKILGEKFSLNERKVEAWRTQRTQRELRVPGKS